MIRWPWTKKGPSPETEQARKLLEATRRDDQRVNQLARRTARILRENNLAPDIMKALGVTRQ